MAQSLSFDASLKLKGCDLKGFIKHFLREDDETRQHSNEQIDASRTHNNMTLVYDEQTGRMIPTRDAEQILQAINSRLSDAIDLESGTYRNNGKKVRSDAVQCRGMILQLDPEFYRENADNPKAIMKSYDNLLQLAKKQYGKENIIAASVHLDETNPHMHILMTPVTVDGRLSQKDFFDKKKLKEAHKEMREELRSKGYDIDMSRRTPQGAKRLTETEYRAFKDSVKKAQELAEKEQQLEADRRKNEADRQHNLQLQQQAQKMAYEASERLSQADSIKQGLEAQKAEFEAYKADAVKDLEAQRQQTLHDVQGLYDKALALHNKLLRMSDAYLKYAQGYGNELGSLKHQIDGLSL